MGCVKRPINESKKSGDVDELPVTTNPFSAIWILYFHANTQTSPATSLAINTSHPSSGVVAEVSAPPYHKYFQPTHTTPTPKTFVIIFSTPKSVIHSPAQLVGSITNKSQRCVKHGFHIAYLHTHRWLELKNLKNEAHLAAGLIHHFSDCGNSVTMRVMLYPIQIWKDATSTHYGLMHWHADFIRTDM